MTARKCLTTWFIMATLLLGASNAIKAGPIIFVDADAGGSNNGSSWANAFNYLQDALTAAAGGSEIRVAQGVYKPDRGAGITLGNPQASFQLKNGVTIKGGYAGFGEPNPDARDVEVYETILSGDLAGDDSAVLEPADLLVESTRAENSYHVVTGNAVDATAVLDGFTITAGNALGDPALYPHDGGGGLYISNGSPTLDSCTITGNSAGHHGGGMLNENSSPTLTSCTFTGNAAERLGGAAANSNSNPTLTNCLIGANATGYWGCGGGMSNSGSSPILVNCAISGNSAPFWGGGIYNVDSSPTLINCTLTDNSAEHGSAIDNAESSNPILANCILWANTSSQIGGAATVSYSDVQGGWPGVGNIDADPLFVDPKGPDNVAGTEDDNLRLLGGSACLDAGDNTAVPPSVTVDLGGDPRFTDDPHTPDTGSGTPPIVDMGAYEGPNQGFLLSTTSLAVPEGGTATFTVALAMDPLGVAAVTVAHYWGDPDITIGSGASLTFDSSNYGHPQTVTLAAAEDGDHSNGEAVFQISGLGLDSATLAATESDNDNIVYVDADAPGTNNGTSWEDAFTDLQDALSVAAAEGDIVNEVRVAQGTYKPAGPAGDRTATFGLINGAAIKGGYAGYGSSNPNARDINLYETILSGDLNGDDSPLPLHNQENSYHVVTADGTEESAILDGFTITSGNADGLWDNDSGGGMLSSFGRHTVRNCTFLYNSAIFAGGAIEHDEGGPTLIDCKIADNWAGFYGGGIHNSSGSSPILKGCKITNNQAETSGGGVYNGYESSASFVNCIFTGNSAGSSGGAISNAFTNVTLINCTFAGNSAPNGEALSCDSYPKYLWASNLVIANCVIWENGHEIWNNDGSTIAAAYSDIRGGWPGEGNINANPLFVDSPDGSTDLHLLAGSPCIDAGDNTAVPSSVHVDYDWRPRFVDDPATADTGKGTPPIVDMGAYESQIVGHALIANAGKDQTAYAWVGGPVDFGSDCGWLDKLQWAPVIEPPPPPPPSKLSEAVDTHLLFTTGGDAHWFAQTKTSYYGGDAAQSGDISHSQNSWMQTVVEGPGVAKFYWKASSEPNYDFLEFYIDGARQAWISGSAAWQQKTYDIPSGSHTLRWRYIKDESVSFGSDCGWVDKFEWEPTAPPPPVGDLSEALDTTSSFTTGGNVDWFAQAKTSYYGGDAAQSGDISHSQDSWMQTTLDGPGVARFYWKVSSEANYDFLEFYINGIRQHQISGSVDWQQKTYDIPAGSHTLKWRYAKDESVNFAGDCGWVDKFEWEPSTPPAGDLSQALDTALSLTTGGNADWFLETTTFYYGGDAAQSGKISQGQESWVQTVVSGPGTVKFYWKVSSQADYDFLEFYIDGVRKDRISGSLDWQQKTYDIPAGSHTLRWRYAKDGIAEVKLDGSKSADPDGHPLTYKWSWTVDGEPYTATGVSPAIELPIGQHTIELIVNHGTQDSSPDTVVITVVGPIESVLWIWPTVIERSNGMMPYVLALARLPGIAKDMVDIEQPSLLYPGAIKSVHQYAVEYEDEGTVRTNVFAFFDKAKLLAAVPENGKLRLHVVGRLETGQYYYGTYWVNIIE